MSMLNRLIKALTPHIRSQKDLDDAYLSESASVYDLERRMRQIEQRSLSSAGGLAYGINQFGRSAP